MSSDDVNRTGLFGPYGIFRNTQLIGPKLTSNIFLSLGKISEEKVEDVNFSDENIQIRNIPPISQNNGFDDKNENKIVNLKINQVENKNQNEFIESNKNIEIEIGPIDKNKNLRDRNNNFYDNKFHETLKYLSYKWIGKMRSVELVETLTGILSISTKLNYDNDNYNINNNKNNYYDNVDNDNNNINNNDNKNDNNDNNYNNNNNNDNNNNYNNNYNNNNNIQKSEINNNIILCDEFFKIANHGNDNNQMEHNDIKNIKITNNNNIINMNELITITNNPFSLLEQSITTFPPKKIISFFENLKEFGVTSELISQKKHENLATLLEENILRSLTESSTKLEHSLRSFGIFPREKGNEIRNEAINLDIEKINNYVDDYLKTCTKLINNFSTFRGPWNLITKKNKNKFQCWIQDPITIFAIQYREEFYAFNNYGEEGSLHVVDFNAEHSLKNEIPYKFSSTIQPINSEKIKLKINLNSNSKSENSNKIGEIVFREPEIFSVLEIKSKTDFLFSLGKFRFPILSKFLNFETDGEFNICRVIAVFL